MKRRLAAVLMTEVVGYGRLMDGLGNRRSFLPLRREQDFARWAEGLHLAGLPE